MFPCMIYKDKKTDYKVVNNLEEYEKWAKEGYGEFEVTVLGRKPESANVVEKPVERPKRRPAKRRKVRAA